MPGDILLHKELLISFALFRTTKCNYLCDYFLDSNDSFYPKPSTADEDKADCEC